MASPRTPRLRSAPSCGRLGPPTFRCATRFRWRAAPPADVRCPPRHRWRRSPEWSQTVAKAVGLATEFDLSGESVRSTAARALDNFRQLSKTRPTGEPVSGVSPTKGGNCWQAGRRPIRGDRQAGGPAALRGTGRPGTGRVEGTPAAGDCRRALESSPGPPDRTRDLADAVARSPGAAGTGSRRQRPSRAEPAHPAYRNSALPGTSGAPPRWRPRDRGRRPGACVRDPW